jgi:hypothetical protein
MSVHALDLLDLPLLYRYRSEAISLDCTRLLTRGNPLGAIGVMSYMNPSRHIYSAITRHDGASVAGGVIQTNGDAFARLLYLAPASEMENTGLPDLIDHLATQAGSWGALHVLAEVDETSPAFIPLRKAGFSVYAWQSIWDVTHLVAPSARTDGNDGASKPVLNGVNNWRRVESVQLPAVQNLHHQIVPPLIQPVEPAPKRPGGFIWNEGARSYAGITTGLVGIVLFPLIHPDVSDVSARLLTLIRSIPSRGGRPVYLCIRSYQAWLEPVLSDLGAESADRQAIMVKHLARFAKEEQTVRAKQPANVSVPASGITRMEGKK